MKTIDTSNIEGMIFGELDQKISAKKKEKEKLQAEIEKLNSKLEAEEKKLDSVKENIEAYKKQFHVVAELKLDIQAVGHLIEAANRDLDDLTESAPDYWKRGLEEYDKFIKPYVDTFAEKKKDLLEIYLQIMKAQATIDRARKDLAGKYGLNPKWLAKIGIASKLSAPTLPINPVAYNFFYDDCLKIGEGKHNKAQELLTTGELRG